MKISIYSQKIHHQSLLNLRPKNQQHLSKATANESNLFTRITRIATTLIIGAFLIACDKSYVLQGDNFAYVTFNNPNLYSNNIFNGNNSTNKQKISSRTLDEYNFNSLIIRIVDSRSQAVLSETDILNSNSAKTTITVPAGTLLNIVGEAYQNNKISFRGELSNIRFKAGESKKLQIPLSDTLQIDIGIDNKASNGNINNSYSFSDDQKFILFKSNANNLASTPNNTLVNDTVETTDKVNLFLRNTVTNTTIQLNSFGLDESIINDIKNNNYDIADADISADGATVVFSLKTNDIGNINGTALSVIFIVNTVTQTTSYITTNHLDETFTFSSTKPQISDDGRFITFLNQRSATANSSDLFIVDQLNETTNRISPKVEQYQLSGDGSTIVYLNTDSYLYRYDLLENTKDLFEDNANDPIFNISRDGEYFVFYEPRSIAISPNTENIVDTLEKTSSKTVIASEITSGQLYRYSFLNDIYEHVSVDEETPITGYFDNKPAALSSNSNYIGFSKGNRVYVKNMSTFALADIGEGHSVFISATGDSLGYTLNNHIYVTSNPVFLQQATLETDYGINLNASNVITFDQGFSFPFYNKIYQTAYVSDQGLITFNDGDHNQAANKIWEDDLAKQPSIAMFNDQLDVTQYSDSAMYAKQFPDRLVITMVNMPSFFCDGFRTLQTVLYIDGRIQIGYVGYDEGSCVDNTMVGISPGLAQDPGVSDFIDDAPFSRNTATAIYEIFNHHEAFDLLNKFILFTPNSKQGYDVRLEELTGEIEYQNDQDTPP